MSFKRNDVQTYIENKQGCFDIESWSSYKAKFVDWTIESSDISPLTNCINSDLSSYFFKAFESFSLAIDDLHNRKFSWAIVKLYYSTFYLLRCEILLANYLIVRNGGLFYSELQAGKKFELFTKGKVRGDHQLTIAFVKELHRNNSIIDPILGNLIDDTDAYTWLMQNRERVNYQQKNFIEPDIDENFNHINQYFESNTIIDLFRFYNSKNYSICFDLDHSILSIPYKKLLQILHKGRGKIDFSGDYLNKLIFYMRLLKKYNINKMIMNELSR